MSVWFVCPSKRPAEQAEPILEKWRERGYFTATQRDHGDNILLHSMATFKRPYLGYAEAVNYLVKAVVIMDPKAEWIVCAGDDTEPEPNHLAEDLAVEFSRHFSGTFGVVQFTGDRWGEDPRQRDPKMRSAYIDRVAGSPWMGREFCLRVNQGRGPLWPEYFHMGCDEELQAVATRLGVFCQCPDLQHLHKHWGRAKPGERMGSIENMPDFLKLANSAEQWKTYKKLFAEREATGFPGSEPL